MTHFSTSNFNTRENQKFCKKILIKVSKTQILASMSTTKNIRKKRGNKTGHNSRTSVNF